MKKRKKRSTIKFLKILITLYLCVIAMPFTFLTTLAKYTSTVSASGTVGIARPVLNLQTKPVTDTVNPVNSMEVNFSVVNFEGDVVNEVKLDYKISFVIDGTSKIRASESFHEDEAEKAKRTSVMWIRAAKDGKMYLRESACISMPFLVKNIGNGPAKKLRMAFSCQNRTPFFKTEIIFT